MKISKLLSLAATFTVAFFIACEPVFAQWQVPDHAVPIGRGAGTGFKSAAPGAVGNILTSNGAGVDPTFKPNAALDWYIVGSAQYPTPQSAVNAANAANGGTVYFPCAEHSLGNGARGLDLRNMSGIRLVGNWSMSTGASACGAVRYNGAGVAIDMSGSHYVEISNMLVVGTASSHMIRMDNQGGAGGLAAYFSIHDSGFYGNAVSGIGISIPWAIIGTIRRNLLIGFVGFRGAEVLLDVTNMVNLYDNTFPSGVTWGIQNITQSIVQGNTFEGDAVTGAYSKFGSPNPCFILNWWGNTHADTTGANDPIIDSDCYTTNLQGNVFDLHSNGTAVKISGSGKLLYSQGDQFESGGGTSVAYDIGAGVNTAEISQINTTAFGPGPATFIVGTPATTTTKRVLGGQEMRGPMVFPGLTSGAGTFSAQAVMGTANYMLPSANSGTMVISATSPLSVHGSSGNMSLGTVPATLGGTGQTSYAVGDLLFASTVSALSKLPGVATGNALISGGVNIAPAWGKIGLTTHVSGTLPIANGGTGTTAGAVVAVKKQSFCPSGCTTTIASGGSGTYTPSAGMLYSIVEAQGSGGGGGGVVGTASQSMGGGGGGAGGYSRSVLTAAQIGASKTVIIGAFGAGGAAGANNGTVGGDVCITTSTCVSGHIVVGKGGSPGTFTQTGASLGVGGLGGVAGTGDLAAVGSPGLGGQYYPAAGINLNAAIGVGGSSHFGGGGPSAVTIAGGAPGNAATGYGAGGSGGFANAAVDRAGGNGSPGMVWITEYTSQ